MTNLVGLTVYYGRVEGGDFKAEVQGIKNGIIAEGENELVALIKVLEKLRQRDRFLVDFRRVKWRDGRMLK